MSRAPTSGSRRQPLSLVILWALTDLIRSADIRLKPRTKWEICKSTSEVITPSGGVEEPS